MPGVHQAVNRSGGRRVFWMEDQPRRPGYRKRYLAENDDADCQGPEMRVFTLHSYDLRTIAGPNNADRGSYRDDLVVSSAQRQLYELINEDQVVWCGQDEPILQVARGHLLHDIDVDERDIVAVIDSLVWCHIIGKDSRYIPP
jgi:hypothetical protein